MLFRSLSLGGESQRDGMPESPGLRLQNEVRRNLVIVANVFLDHIAHGADDQRNARDAGFHEVIQDMAKDRLAGDIQKDFREGEGMGPKARTDSGDRDYGFQRAMGGLLDIYRNEPINLPIS